MVTWYLDFEFDVKVELMVAELTMEDHLIMPCQTTRGQVSELTSVQ